MLRMGMLINITSTKVLCGGLKYINPVVRIDVCTSYTRIILGTGF
jgi:hypothetical protein